MKLTKGKEQIGRVGSTERRRRRGGGDKINGSGEELRRRETSEEAELENKVCDTQREREKAGVRGSAERRRVVFSVSFSSCCNR